MLSFKPTFSLSSLTLINRIFSSSLCSAIRVMSSAYLRLLVFLPEILSPACASSSPAFLMMYSVYKLNKEGEQYTALMPVAEALAGDPGRDQRSLEPLGPGRILGLASPERVRAVVRRPLGRVMRQP